MIKDEKKQKVWNYILWIILGFLIGYFLFGRFDDYTYCIDNCVSDNYYCADPSYSDGQGNYYISDLEYESCADELKYCVSTCK